VPQPEPARPQPRRLAPAADHAECPTTEPAAQADGAASVAALARALAAPVAACDRAPAQWVYHLVLRNDDADRWLSDAEWAQVCRSAMDATGIAPADDPAGCRWVAVRHADEHVHLVAALAREDGRVPRIWNDYRALAQVAHTYEQRFGLRSTAGRDDNTAARRPGVKEEAVTAERAGRVPPREVLRGRVKAAAGASRDFAEFTGGAGRAGRGGGPLQRADPPPRRSPPCRPAVRCGVSLRRPLVNRRRKRTSRAFRLARTSSTGRGSDAVTALDDVFVWHIRPGRTWRSLP
jgi:hypothetical protein